MILLLSFKKNKAIEDKNKKSFLFLLLVVFLLLFSRCEENRIYLAFEELNKNLINQYISKVLKQRIRANYS